jgi:hypothetical protein
MWTQGNMVFHQPRNIWGYQKLGERPGTDPSLKVLWKLQLCWHLDSELVASWVTMWISVIWTSACATAYGSSSRLIKKGLCRGTPLKHSLREGDASSHWSRICLCFSCNVPGVCLRAGLGPMPSFSCSSSHPHVLSQGPADQEFFLFTPDLLFLGIRDEYSF